MLTLGATPVAPVQSVSPGCGVVAVRRQGDRSVVTRAFATSPLRLLNPSNHGDAAWIYTSSLGGGLVDGDDIQLVVDVGPDASAYLSTQSATKVYRSPRGTKTVLRGTVAPGGLLLVVPDPVVPFAGSRYRQVQQYDIAPDAGLVVVDVLASGRRAAGERWRFLEYVSTIEVFMNGRLRIHDALCLHQEDGDVSARLGRFNVLALALVAGGRLRGEVGSLTMARPEPVTRRADQIVSISAVGDAVCLIRIATTTAERASRTLRDLLQFVPAHLGDDPWLRKW